MSGDETTTGNAGIQTPTTSAPAVPHGSPVGGSTPARNRRGWKRWLFLAVLAAYCFTVAGQFQTVDAAQELSVAVSMRDGRGFQSDFPVSPGGGTTVGRGGWSYAGHDLGASLLYYPFTLIPGSIERVPADQVREGLPGTPGRESIGPSRRLYFTASFLPALLGALIVLAFAATLEELGFAPVTTAITSLLLAFTSLIWVYAHVSFDATATTLGVIVAIWALVRFRNSGSTRAASAVGVAVAFSILMRTDSVLMAPFLVLPIIWYAKDRHARRWRSAIGVCAVAVVPVIVAGVTNLWFNWYRFGSILDNGHSDDGFLRFSPRIGDGLYGQIASPGKGLLVLSPIVIVALFSWRWFLRRNDVLGVAILGASFTSLVAHGAIVGWAGDQAWGARFTVLLVPILALPAARTVDRIRRKRVDAPMTWLVVGLSVAGFLIQLSGVLVDFFASVTERRLRGEDTGTDPHHLPYMDGWAVLSRAVTGGSPHPDLTPQWAEQLHVARFDVWWVRAADVSGWNIFTVGVPIALVVVALWASTRLCAALRPRPRSLDQANA